MASTLPALALIACVSEPDIVYRTPPLNEADQERLSCAAFPEIIDVLNSQPSLVFLSGSDGEAVVTDGQFKWVRFDIVNKREARLIQFGDVSARGVHFECSDDLQWTAKLITDLQE